MKTVCPYCNYQATGHETLDEEKSPLDNDVSFCINCGEVSEFKDKILIKLDVETLDEEVNDIRVAWLKRRAIDGVKK